MTTCLGKSLFSRITASAFRKLLSVCVFCYFPFGFEGRMWDLIVSVPDHCLSFYFDSKDLNLILVITFVFTSCIKRSICSPIFPNRNNF